MNIFLSFVFEITSSLEGYESNDNIFESGEHIFFKRFCRQRVGRDREEKRYRGGINDNINEYGSQIKSF